MLLSGNVLHVLRVLSTAINYSLFSIDFRGVKAGSRLANSPALSIIDAQYLLAS